MRHKCLVLTVKKWLKSVYIYGSYRKIKTGVPLFWTTLYIDCTLNISTIIPTVLCMYITAPLVNDSMYFYYCTHGHGCVCQLNIKENGGWVVFLTSLMLLDKNYDNAF